MPFAGPEGDCKQLLHPDFRYSSFASTRMPRKRLSILFNAALMLLKNSILMLACTSGGLANSSQ